MKFDEIYIFMLKIAALVSSNCNSYFHSVSTAWITNKCFIQSVWETVFCMLLCGRGGKECAESDRWSRGGGCGDAAARRRDMNHKESRSSQIHNRATSPCCSGGITRSIRTSTLVRRASSAARASRASSWKDVCNGGRNGCSAESYVRNTRSSLWFISG